MSFVRHFTLLNSQGAAYDITTTSALMVQPKGLGYARENTYRQIGKRFSLVSAKPKQVDIEGKIIFTPPKAYDKYNAFVQFLSYEPLRIKYQPMEEDDPYLDLGAYRKKSAFYYKDVAVNEIQKEELTKYATLDVPITLTPLTPWYELVTGTTDVNLAAGLIWEEQSTWPFLFENGDGANVYIDSDTVTASPCRLEIPGPIENPHWRHYANGVLQREGKVNCEVRFGQRLVIDNTGETYIVGIYNSAGELVENVYQDCDFSMDKFIEVQNGHNSIYVTDDAGHASMLKAEVRLYYESV